MMLQILKGSMRILHANIQNPSPVMEAGSPLGFLTKLYNMYGYNYIYSIFRYACKSKQ